MIAENLRVVQAKVTQAAQRSCRAPESVCLICVTKGVSLDQVQEAVEAGVTDLGESRVQEAAPKIEALGRKMRWHMIGHLQRNKAKLAASLFDTIHSLDRLELAEMLERHAQALNREVSVFLEVNTSRESQKHGVTPDQVGPLLETVGRLPHLKVLGLMTMAAESDDPETARPCFKQLKALQEQFGLKELSMGMSQDYEVAIEEGATMVRVGSAIFKGED